MLSYRCLRVCGLIAALAASASFGVSAQELSRDQREVWAFIEDCNQRYFDEDLNGILDCYHDDFTGWLYDDAVPRTKQSVERLLPAELESTEPIAFDLRPITIRVFGDVAVAHYSLQWVQKLTNGEVMTLRMKYTDSLLREGGSWSWLADHGGEVQTD